MPRPKRARNAAPSNATKAQEPLSDTDHLDEERGRARGRRRTTRSMGSRLSLGEEHAVREANRARDAALDRLANEDATSTTAGGSGQTAGDDTRSSVEIGRRAMATPAMRRDTTGLDLADDDVFGDLDESFADGEIPRGGGGGGGGRSADSTSLSFSSFKPRSRQSSIIGRHDPPIRPSSRGPNTPGVGSSFNIGVFRRRAREPSILGTSRRPRSEAGGTTANNSEVESEGEFEPPEAESTPLNARRRTRNSMRGVRGSSQSAEPAPAPGAGSRKRKSVESHEEGVRPEKTSRVEPEEPQPQLVDDDEGSDSELSAIASSPSPPPPGFFQRPVTPVNMDDITAPPASSDSEEDAQVWPDIHTLAKKRRRPSVTTPMRTDDNLSNVSSPPSLTHSPNFAERSATTRQRGRAAKRHHHHHQERSPKVTTADLTNLLPKRRYKRVRDDPFGLGSDEEFDTADLAQDDDELSYLDARAARKRKGNNSRSRSRAASARPGSRAGSRVRGNASVLKPKQTPASERRSARIGGGNSSSSSKKTYQHRRSSDKENESGGDDDNEEGEEEEEEGEGLSQFVPLPDDTFEMGSTGGDATTGDRRRDFATTEELQQAAKKFKEVDRWELEYEEVTETPSPEDAR
ncbi:hypothetical protein JDV02_000990 [Purpureocillium takamizusanense]|uniref:Uncharacterized protein n=1 Tax=Purpureocillium takamizusanense TaxID=2060973 RepID=A0A9Q8Q885_9HYPO|nr:uncharacterized protein JDV02_000990 [Purpureocillium takamizusanense]UNI14354.1 hypothetical protein JDV02_000990 [Purpureocillium takamizusanense]